MEWNTGSTNQEWYVYDASGITDTIPFDSSLEIVLHNGTTTKYYTAGGQRVAMRTGSTLYYLLNDDLGGTSLVLTSGGGVQAVQLYTPYGAVRYSQGMVPTTYNYTEQRLDSETGLLYYGFRYYDPVTGRFVRADTVEGNLLGMDSYAYVKGNPETNNDPTGHGDPFLIYIVAWYESFHQGQTILLDTPGSHALRVPGTRDEPDIANIGSHVIWDAKTSGDIQSRSFFDMGVGWPSDDYVRTGSRRVQRLV